MITIADSVPLRLASMLRGKVRGRSLEAVKAAEEHFASHRDGLIIVQMVDGLLDISFLPDVLAGTWELVLHPAKAEPS